MAKADIDKIIETVNQLTEKQKLSDELTSLISSLTESTDSEGNVEIDITRIKKVIKFPASVLISTITDKKTLVETERDAIADKITIQNGK